MEPYTGLAAVYDFLVAGVDFEAWTDYLEEVLHRFGHNPRTVLDLACGTGKTTLPLARRGYRVTGMDISPAMVKMAADKAREQGLEVPFFTGDMRSFELAEPVELITCFHDGLNYLPSIGDLEKTFRQVYKNLVPGGLFIGDMNAIGWLAGTKPETAVIEEPDLTLIWQSNYEAHSCCWEINLIAFIRRGEIYYKCREKHREYGYLPEEVRGALQRAGLKHLATFDAFSFNPVHPDSRRHFYIARKEQVT